MMLEMFVAFLQAFIFSLLAAVFIGQIREARITRDGQLERLRTASCRLTAEAVHCRRADSAPRAGSTRSTAGEVR